ncbi:hypothetical protein NBRC110019_05200 [Neptunitalea chrysea]|uniref:Uncharacterized protein n=1 Tax=Neptunitalea chrysea TaxID=1647581 RepID=A0A9W6B2X3_9FLAO|nr:hypothetical protein NBRC110019_05200 [Neptunitalea chrysea]
MLRQPCLHRQIFIFLHCIKAEATPNTEMTLIVDVNIDLLKELREFGSGSVKILKAKNDN